ncbi:MAG: penicillin-binding protein [Actinomycetota bacterium]|jgi:penicillin-binding protein 1A|nr:penicillin-binding protein [Actinomycetota bacterium]
MRRTIRALLRTFALFIICSAAVPVAVSVTILATFLFVPLPATIPEPKPTVASQISHLYTVDPSGNEHEIGIFRKFEQSIPVAPGDIPAVLKNAVISSEDRNFYKHGGVDIRGSARAFWADVRNKSVVQGGSTITQQYVKNAYTDKKRNIVRKVREAILASQVDRKLSKDEILFKYLSSIYLGDGIYGVGAAAESYFRKPVTQLTVAESALLAGIIPAPSYFAPRSNPTGAEIKRKIVLTQMLQQGFITQPQYDEAKGQVVWLAARGAPGGPATQVYSPVQAQTQYPYFVDYVQKYLVAQYGHDVVFGGGLHIDVTMDTALQDLAEKTVSRQLAGTRPPLEMALASVEPPTGYVKALVGGRDFYNGQYAQVNLALGQCPHPKPDDKAEVLPSCLDAGVVSPDGGGSGRQPGSSFKPYVLATAFSKGYSPSKVYRAPGVFVIPGCKPVHSAADCQIHNAEGGGMGSATIRTATVESINTVYAQIVRDVGCKETAEMAKKLGITSAWWSPKVHTCSGNYALGVIDVSPLDMASAYSVFANRGLRQPATPVLRVTDSTGKVLEDNTKRKGTQVIDQIVADNVTDVLRGVITSGTGTHANIGRPAAGKTGTTENFTNAWFVGFTPTLSTSVWMGYANSQDPKRASLRGIKGVSRVFGGTIPANTWHDFMAQALKNVPVTDFSQPAPIQSIAAALNRKNRSGFDPGAKRAPSNTSDGGPFIYQPAAPKAQPPPTTAPPTTSTTSPDSTTSTTFFSP